jgi:predicted site-specific integrase-resolvase
VQTISTTQASERLSAALGYEVSSQLVRLWRKRGILEGEKGPGGRWRIVERSVSAIEAEHGKVRSH